MYVYCVGEDSTQGIELGEHTNFNFIEIFKVKLSISKSKAKAKHLL